MNYSFYLLQSQGKRDNQEDCINHRVFNDVYDLHIIADGMGGHVGGEMASGIVVQIFFDHMRQHLDDQTTAQDIPEMLRSAMQKANQAIATRIKQDADLSGMGTTLIAILYDKIKHCFWYLSVGDSLIYALNQKGFNRLNQNHAYYEELLLDVQKGIISQQEADRHPQRQALTSALMGSKIELIDCPEEPYYLKSGDIILMASDGIQTLSDQAQGEIHQLLERRDNFKNLSAALLRAIENKQNPYQDNTSIVIFGDEQFDSLTVDIKNIPTAHHSGKSSRGLWLAIFVFLSLLFTAIVYIWINSEKSPSVDTPSTPSSESQAQPSPADQAQPSPADQAQPSPADQAPSTSKTQATTRESASLLVIRTKSN